MLEPKFRSLCNLSIHVGHIVLSVVYFLFTVSFRGIEMLTLEVLGMLMLLGNHACFKKEERRWIAQTFLMNILQDEVNVNQQVTAHQKCNWLFCSAICFS